MSANHYVVNSNTVGTFQISAQDAVDSTARVALGLTVLGYSQYWGGGEFIYAQYGGTVPQYGLCVNTPALTSGQLIPIMTAVPNTANLGRAVYVAMVGGSSGNYGWFMKAGLTPVNGTASVTADTAFGITAAGQIGAIANGKQIIGARSILAATTTSAKSNCTGNSGSYQINVPNSDGWFVGAYLSGTGVGTNTVVSKISPDGRTVTVTVANSAAISGTVTATYNNATIYYNVCAIERPIAQGQVS